jgi:hypothetical protein
VPASAGSLGYLLTPVVAFLVVGVLALLLRWAFGGRPRSLVERRARAGPRSEYGLLVDVAAPGTFVEGELLRRRLLDHGVRATVAGTDEGPRLMVFAADEHRARRLLAG